MCQPWKAVVSAGIIAATTACSGTPAQDPAPGPTRFDPATVLPVSTDALASAVGVAEKFGSAVETWRFDEPPAAYIRTLEPFTTSTLLA